jgi:uncharacterized membrane protein YbhN (UPF0104 family)
LLRYMDVMIIMSLLATSLCVISLPVVALYRRYIWLLILALVGMLALLFFVPLLSTKFTKLKKFIPKTNYTGFVVSGLRETLVAWLCLYGYLYCTVQALNLQFSFWTVVFAATFSILTIVLPVSAVGNFGTFEAGWVIGFVLLGMSKGDALATGFFTNVVLTLLNAVLAGIGFFILEHGRTVYDKTASIS